MTPLIMASVMLETSKDILSLAKIFGIAKRGQIVTLKSEKLSPIKATCLIKMIIYMIERS